MPPETLFLAHLAPHLAATQEVLATKLQAMQGANEELVQQILAQRREIEGLVAGLEDAVRDLEGANEAMEGVFGGGRLGGRCGRWRGSWGGGRSCSGGRGETAFWVWESGH